MTRYVNLRLIVRVSDEQALFHTAKAYLTGEDHSPAEIEAVLGTEERPDIGACCAMLLDRSELLGEGAQIDQHEVEIEPSDDDDGEE